MISVVRGMRDLHGSELAAWQQAEDVIRATTSAFGYSEYRTPILEFTELFKRGVGTDTDIVGKEMYTFEDRGGDSLTLRPEMTAPIVRAAIENNLVRHSPTTRLWYLGPLFRYERPQKGRYRQFHQFGAECLGSAQPEADAEIILLAMETLSGIGIHNFSLEINTLGSPEARSSFRAELVAYLGRNIDALSADSIRRLETNPLRILDSKDPSDIEVVKGAPRLYDYLDDESKNHFAAVCGILDASGIAYAVNHRMVRGLDYYSHTVFEIVTNALGSQNAICGGGRYDPLFAILGGTATPAVGFSIGMERVMLLLEAERGGWHHAQGPSVYLCCASDAARLPVQLVALRLRRNGISVVTDVLRRSVKAQVREADKLGARFVVTIGDDELARQEALVKTMATREQKSVPLANLVGEVLGAEAADASQ
jgi:histidyl-tRNA synthetase